MRAAAGARGCRRSWTGPSAEGCWPNCPRSPPPGHVRPADERAVWSWRHLWSSWRWWAPFPANPTSSSGSRRSGATASASAAAATATANTHAACGVGVGPVGSCWAGVRSCRPAQSSAQSASVADCARRSGVRLQNHWQWRCTQRAEGGGHQTPPVGERERETARAPPADRTRRASAQGLPQRPASASWWGGR